MIDIVNQLMTWFGWAAPETVAELIDGLVRLAVGLGLVLFIFKSCFRLAGMHGIL